MKNFIKVRKNYFRIGHPAKTNVVFDGCGGYVCFNFSANWQQKIFGCNTKYFWF